MMQVKTDKARDLRVANKEAAEIVAAEQAAISAYEKATETVPKIFKENIDLSLTRKKSRKAWT